MPVPSGKSDALYSLRGRCTYSAAHSSKIFKSVIVLLCQGCCWIGKNTYKEFNRVIMLTIRPRNKNLAIPFSFVLTNISEQSFLYYVKTSSYTFWVWLLILFPHLLCEQMTFDFTSQMKVTNYISKFWQWSLKGSLIRVIKNSPFDQHFVYIWSKPF